MHLISLVAGMAVSKRGRLINIGLRQDVEARFDLQFISPSLNSVEDRGADAFKKIIER